MSSTAGSDRDQLVRDLEEARNELRASYEGLRDEQMTRLGAVGAWSVKDVLSHIASWEEVALPDLARLARGDTAILASMDLYSANFDDFNAVIMSLRRNLPLDQVLRELDIVRADFMAGVSRLPDSVLAEGQFGRILVQITGEHDREHAEGIRRWRQQEGL
jgi:hypothetical protein